MPDTTLLLLSVLLVSSASAVPLGQSRDATESGCTPYDGWLLLTTFNNLDGSKDIPVTFRASVGTSFAPGILQSEREVIFQAFSEELGKEDGRPSIGDIN